MIDNLYAGIITKYTGSLGASLRTALGDTGGANNKLWAEVAPEGTAMPYIVMNCISDLPDNTFTEDIEVYRIQFTIWTSDMNPNTVTTGIKAIYEALRALLDKTTLTISGWTNFSSRWLGTQFVYDDEALGRAVDYEFMIEK